MATIPVPGGGPADRYLAQSGTSLFMAIAIPLAYVDNTYGLKDDTSASAHTHITWGGQEGDHTFEKRRKSDGIKLDMWCGNAPGTKLELDIDYLKDDPPYVATIKKLSAGLTAGVASSLEYNMTLLPQLTSTSPLLADPTNPLSYAVAPSDLALYGSWVFPVIYEMEIVLPCGAPVLGGTGFINGFVLKVEDLHASPNKNDADWDDVPPEDFRDVPSGGDPIPEPLTMLGFFGGIVGVGGYLRRRRLR